MQARSEETRARLLSVAENLFAEQGFDATGVADICAAAGVSKGAFYHHFPTKQALFHALMEGWLAQLDQQMNAALQASASVGAGLLNIAGGTGPIFEAAGTRSLIVFEFWMQASRHPEVWQTAVAPYRRYLERFATIVRAGIEEGTFRADLDPLAAGQTLMALAMGLLLQAFLDPQGADWGKATLQSVQILLRGFENR
ncbi:MAG: TetR/AcrR family transcriptional regulator [Anaerolineaceae bacterium]|nr:TetR/AcrR family transcriptional regulator [Anaerolineaceae bacterium]